ncbi:hypothetical protein [Yersinia pseudotuberculosis]|uniref:hypothetical protein n=1 Tax=Yersinia pseudotuberculosis TaxID=633 RepID=UPI0005AD3C78|nr:hypothetical protein [Yersinia pseudotuberculosis]AJJ05487.1 hypothetical protein BZ20_991 [Yersinia pseudotuberculosis]MBO1588161.1 hypothetical protein [Yersinia pseudotuberculosis]VEE72963.1 Uncharacterised protein [Yersinia pseudotuberculosis]
MVNRQRIINYTGLALNVVFLMSLQAASAAPVENGPQLITDGEGHMVCHFCGPEKMDSYLLADYPQGYKIKTDSYSKIWDMNRYAILMDDSIPANAANQTPRFYYIDKFAKTPVMSTIQFDDDSSDLTTAKKIDVTEKAGTTSLQVRWQNGEKNNFSLDNQSPAYHAKFFKDEEDKLYCRNCGGKEQSIYIKNSDESSLYDQVIDTTYFLLLHQNAGMSCLAGNWYAVSKTSEVPEAKLIDNIGCDEITDFTPSAKAGVTHLDIHYLNGKKKTITLDSHL